MWLLPTRVALIESRIVTCQSDSAYVVPRVKDQGSKSFKFNCSNIWNELPTNVKHVQQKIRFNIFYNIFIVSVIIFYSFLGYIYLHVSLYIECVSYPLNVRSTVQFLSSASFL